MEKTIKQIADELGVSKDKIKYRVGKLPSIYLVKKDGVTYIKNEGIQEIAEQLGKISPINSPVNYPLFTQSDKVVELLEKELDILRQQLAEKDKLIRLMITQIVKEDKDLKTYSCRIADLAKFLGIDSSNLYRDVQDICVTALDSKVHRMGYNL